MDKIRMTPRWTTTDSSVWTTGRMRDDVQEVVAEHWDTVNNDNVKDIADIDGYWEDFYNMFGFKIDGVDYSADVDIM